MSSLAARLRFNTGNRPLDQVYVIWGRLSRLNTACITVAFLKWAKISYTKAEFQECKQALDEYVVKLIKASGDSSDSFTMWIDKS